MIIYKHVGESTEDGSVFNGKIEIETASREEWEALLAGLPNGEAVECDTVCRCSVRTNAEIMAEILDYDIRGEIAPFVRACENSVSSGEEQLLRFSFGEAIDLMRRGHKMRRRGWNGKGQYIELASAISYKNPAGEIVNAEHDAIGNRAVAFVGTSGVQMGWLASQADMLAEDWELAE